MNLIELGVAIFLFSVTTTVGLTYYHRQTFPLKIQDKHKQVLTINPTSGGLVVIIVVLISFGIIEYFVHQIFIVGMIGVTVLYTLFGLIDDAFTIKKQKYMMVIPLILTFPMVVNLALLLHFQNGNHLPEEYPGFLPDIGLLYPLIVVPVYIMVVANLLNMHASYNGLSTGLTILLVSGLLFKSYQTGNEKLILLNLAFLGALLGFFVFNRYPSTVFEGNCGTFAFGGLIGVIIIVGGFIISGIIMLIPHIINFLMYIYLLLNKEKYITKKFAEVRKDNVIVPPHPLKLKWTFHCYYRLTEKQGIIIMYLFSVPFVVLGALY